jgi:hypothetical protein
MTEAKHTPGPWTLNKYGEPVDATGENIRAKGLALTNSDEAKANTQLIVAAPELLDAILLLQGQDFRLLDDENGAEIRKRALAAIAKATR